MVLQTNPIDTSADVPATDQYDYDAAGELVQSIDGDGRAITYSYDGIGRETGENWYASVNSSGVPQGSATETISYTYNAAGLLYDGLRRQRNVHLHLRRGRRGDQRDPADRRSDPDDHFHRPIHGRQPHAACGDDRRHQRLCQQLPVPERLGPDEPGDANRHDGGDAVAAKTVTFAYDRLGEFTSISRYQNADATANLVAQSTYGYDLNGNLTSLVYSNSGSTLPSYSWTYDPLGNMTSSNETLGSIVDSVNYTSDSTGQLLTATATSGPPSESYTYDSNGNRETVTTSSGQVTCITGPDNELLYDGTYTYSYDADGNQTARWSPPAPARRRRSPAKRHGHHNLHLGQPQPAHFGE